MTYYQPPVPASPPTPPEIHHRRINQKQQQPHQHHEDDKNNHRTDNIFSVNSSKGLDGVEEKKEYFSPGSKPFRSTSTPNHSLNYAFSKALSNVYLQRTEEQNHYVKSVPPLKAFPPLVLPDHNDIDGRVAHEEKPVNEREANDSTGSSSEPGAILLCTWELRGLADFTLSFTNQSDVSMLVHKEMLALKSTFFANMFRQQPYISKYRFPASFAYSSNDMECFLNVLYGIYDQILNAVKHAEDSPRLLCYPGARALGDDGRTYEVISMNNDGTFMARCVEDPSIVYPRARQASLWLGISKSVWNDTGLSDVNLETMLRMSLYFQATGLKNLVEDVICTIAYRCDNATLSLCVRLADELKLVKLHDKAISEWAKRHEANEDELKEIEKHDLIELVMKSWAFIEK